MQSPGFRPTPSPFVQENTTQTFLSILNVSTIAEARLQPSNRVLAAQTLQIALSRYGSFSYGPVVDGVFAPALPGQLLASGNFAQNLSIMLGHNANEGPLFAPPYIQSDADFRSFVQLNQPSISNASLNTLTDRLYPSNFSGAYGYTTQLERVFAFIAESSFTCNTNFFDRAYDNATHSYLFAVPPAFHGFDIPYTFYNGQGTNLTAGLYAPVAQLLQAYITNFAISGNPNAPAPGLPLFPVWGSNATELVLNATGTSLRRDETENERCRWWQQGLYY